MNLEQYLMFAGFVACGLFGQIAVASVLSGVYWSTEWHQRRFKTALSYGVGRLIRRSLALISFESMGWKVGWTIEFQLHTIHAFALQLLSVWLILLAPVTFIVLTQRLGRWGKNHHVPMALTMAFLGTFLFIRAYGALLHLHAIP